MSSSIDRELATCGRTSVSGQGVGQCREGAARATAFRLYEVVGVVKGIGF
jgi:hypothetical protein